MIEDLVDAGWLLRPCVYLLLWQQRVVYVGQSQKPLSRLYTHAAAARGAKLKWVKLRQIKFDGIKIYPCAAEALREVERDLIALHRPRYNVLHNDRRVVEVARMRDKEHLKVPIELVVNGTRIQLHRRGAPRAPLAASSQRIRRI